MKTPTALRGGLKKDGLKKIGIVTARFNSEVTSKLEQGAIQALQEMGFSSAEFVLTSVPGAFEIPLAAKAMLEQNFDAVIALGAVIRGETTHYDYVCSSVERGCTELQLKYTRPVAFGVLTTENDEQALARAGGAHGNKGYEAAQVAVEMAQLLQLIRESRS